MRQKQFKQAFYRKGSRDEVCLLIHGFCGNAAEMRPLAQYLNQQGYAVSAVCLPGHASSLENMDQTTYKDWIATVEAEFLYLRKKYSRVHVIGQSMGALLSFYLAQHCNPDTVIALCVPFRFANRSLHMAQAIQFIQCYRKWDPMVLPKETLPYLCGYNKMPWSGMAQLRKLTHLVERSLPRVKQPTLFVYGVKDKLIDHAGVALAYHNIQSKVKKLLILPNSGHMLTLDADRQKMFDSITQFIEMN